MEIRDYVDQLKLELTGRVLQSEITDEEFENIVNLSVRELNRYYNGLKLMTVNASSCIDLKPYTDINSVVNVYRQRGVGIAKAADSSASDPVFMSQLQMYNFGNTAFSVNWLRDYATYSTAQQVSNTLSTDLLFKEDKYDKKLYVNLPQGAPDKLTIEYIPLLRDASEVVGEYWIDILSRLSLAHAKVIIGRIRTRYTQSNALWSNDGETILAEGIAELEAIREQLRVSNDYFLPVD